MNYSLTSITTKWALKSVNTYQQLQYLKNARVQKFLPRGIAEQMKFVSAIHDDALQSSLQEMMNFSGSRILDLLIIYYTKWNNSVRATYYTNLAKLENSLTPEEFTPFKSKLDKKIQREKVSCMKTHQSKLIRDSEHIKCPYKDVSETQLPPHLRQRVKVNVKRTNRRLRKRKPVTRNRRRTVIKGVVPSLDNIPSDKLSNSVINLSSKITDLTSHQLLLFYLGKSFAPTPALPDYSKFKLDLLQFVYRLRYAWHWFKNPKPQSSDINPNALAIKCIEDKLIEKEETKPIQACNNHCLEFFIEQVSKELLQTNSRRTNTLPDNLPEESRKALKDMKNWKDTVIRPADKGSKFFILDREEYVNRVMVHLNDTNTFTVVQDKAEAVESVVSSITNWVNHYSDELGMSSKIASAIIPSNKCKPGNNYVLLKAHKPEQNFPGRLISTGCASFTKSLSALTAIELCKVELPYIIKDTNHLLKKLLEINESGILADKEVIHVSFDVKSMFPSISKSVGLEQCKKHLDKRLDPLFSTQCILEAIEITLDHNLTEFEGVMYKQIKGTAMGPKNACIYADVAMNSIDEMVNDGEWDSNFRPLLWARFRDDIYIPWTHGLEMLNRFHEFLNSRLPGIEFTKEHSSHGIAFLDTYIYCTGNNELQTKAYSKPCDEHTFLVPSSCHAAHNLRNIPYSIGHRIYRISSEEHEYELSKNEFTEHLKARGYSIGIIHEAFNKIESADRVTYLKPKIKNAEETRVFPLVTDFNPGLPNIGSILHKHKHILHLDKELTRAINPDNIFASFRGANTLQDMLIHSKLPTLSVDYVVSSETLISSQNSGYCQPCKKLCVLCKNYLVKTDVAYSHHINRTFKINDKVDCDTANIVYIINDNICKVSSVGCTADSMKVRFRNHKSHIKHNKRMCEVSKHFSDNQNIHNLDKSSTANYDMSLKQHIEVIIIEHVDVSGVSSDSKSRLKKCKEREWYWQNNLKTHRQYGGLNIREERS